MYCFNMLLWTKKYILILIFKSLGINIWIISSMFHLMKTKNMLHKCQWDHTTEVQLSNYKATIDYNVASNNKWESYWTAYKL
jgi:hypothetical protein